MVHDQQTARTQRLSLYLADNAKGLVFGIITIILTLSHIHQTGASCGSVMDQHQACFVSLQSSGPEWGAEFCQKKAPKSLNETWTFLCLYASSRTLCATCLTSSATRVHFTEIKPAIPETLWSHFDENVRISTHSFCFLSFCEPVCGQWQWKRWKLIYSLSKSLWLYQMNHQISAVPEKNLWLWISPTMMRWALIKKTITWLLLYQFEHT